MLATARVGQATVLGVLTIRATYCLYATAVVAPNLRNYDDPALAVGALLLAVGASTGLGLMVWRRRAIPMAVAVLDAVVSATALLAVALALNPSERAGSLNWALAYSVGCAIWLGFGGRWVERLAMACALGVAYGASTLIGVQPDRALIVTVAVNAISAPFYFGISIAVYQLIRRLADDTDAAHAVEREHLLRSAALGERERLFRDVHEHVMATLELVADGQATDEEVRSCARSEAILLRQVLSGAPSGLGSRLAQTAKQASPGWELELVDEELVREPSPAVAEALCDAFDQLLRTPPMDEREGRLHVRASRVGQAVELTFRMPGETAAYNLGVERARARLAGVAGLAELRAGLAGEVRFVLTVAE